MLVLGRNIFLEGKEYIEKQKSFQRVYLMCKFLRGKDLHFQQKNQQDNNILEYKEKYMQLILQSNNIQLGIKGILKMLKALYLESKFLLGIEQLLR